MNDWTKWALGIVSTLILIAVVAVWKLVANKADKSDLVKAIESGDLALVKAIEFVDKDIKEVNLRMDQSLAIIAQAVSKTDLIERLGSASTRTDDQDRRVQRDITELKTDLKTLTEKVTAVDKKLDELPTRVASLETTRNTNQQK